MGEEAWLEAELKYALKERDTARRWARVWKEKAKLVSWSHDEWKKSCETYADAAGRYMTERDKLRAELEGTQKLVREGTMREYSLSVKVRFAEDEANQLRAELADLRGRTCAGCKWAREDKYRGDSTLTCTCDEIENDEGIWSQVKKDFHCKAWEKKY